MFKLFDFENKMVLRREELVVLFRCCICSLQAMCGKKSYPSILDIEKKIDSILKKFDLQDTQHLTLHEFQSLVSKDTEILQLLKSFRLVSTDDLREVMEDENATIECDSDIDAEIKTKHLFETGEGDIEVLKEDIGFKAARKRQLNIEINKKQISDKLARPVKYAEDTRSNYLPNIEMELLNIHGIRSADVRNSVKISPNGDLVFFTGKAAVIYDRKMNTQRIFQNHVQQISCIASFESLFATGELGEDPAIHIWDYKTLQKKFTLQGILKKGISHLCFSHDGRKLAALEVGENHTVAIYDFAKIVAGRATEFKDLVHSIFKGPRQVVSFLLDH